MTQSVRARYIMIGGFLGAGKTTAISRLAERLSRQGLRVGLITNDQGSELVDTAMLRSRGFRTEEISGGCFCCRFNSLVEAASKLTQATKPEVFIAEPVGSCTDLVATVTYPLRRMYGESYTIAPLSVVLDPVRAQRVLGLVEGGQFSEKVRYIYLKQLEEADWIVINKRETLDEVALERLTTVLEERFPQARVMAVSARTGEGLDEWFSALTEAEQVGGESMEVDYGIYAEGEALLGWLNATVAVGTGGEMAVDGNALVRAIAERVQAHLGAAGAEIAHLKMTLSPNEGLSDLAVINLVRNDFVPELSQELSDEIFGGQLIINCRAEADPEHLVSTLERALGEVRDRFGGVEMTLEHCEHFRPGKPEPTHRMLSGV